MKNENKPAFPFVNQEGSSIEDREVHYGLTKREYFAAMAMQGLLANPKLAEAIALVDINAVTSLTKSSVIWADSLLKQLES